MKLNELLKDYVNRRESKERRAGRYWASDLYGIITGKAKPEDFFKAKTFDLKSCRNIVEGELRELALKQLLDFSRVRYDYQVKKVKTLYTQNFGEIELVAIADFLFDNMIVECKSPTRMTGIKEYHYPQLEAQYRIFGKPIYVMYLKERFEYRSFKYAPSERRWKEILNKLVEFHVKLCQYQPKKKVRGVKGKLKKP